MTSRISGWCIRTATGRFTASVRLLGYVDCLSRVPGDWYARFCGEGVIAISSPYPTSYQAQREQTYRAQALKLYPWICARCGREFSGTKLRELTVHHKDHNHDNNPPDGSNWELLCLYCHEKEHARQQVADVYGEATPGEEREPRSTYRPFADLKDLLQRKA